MIALLTVVIFCTPPPAKPPSPLAGVTAYADVDLKYQRGEVSVLAIRPGRFATPTNLTRWRGRFVATVTRAKKNLVDVEFDFPLVAEAETTDVEPRLRDAAERVRQGVTSSTTVRVPWPEGADGLTIWDSATRKTIAVPLKPMTSAPAPASHAPSPPSPPPPSSPSRSSSPPSRSGSSAPSR